MRVGARLRHVGAAVLGVTVLLQLLGCAPEPGPGVSPRPTPDTIATPSPSAASPTPSPTPAPTETATAEPAPDAGGADVVIITADLQPDGLEVTGIVTGQTDPTGICLLTVSRGGIARTAEATVNPTGGNSYCPLMVIPRSELSPGEWQVALGYRAAGAQGQSSPVTVEVP